MAITQVISALSDVPSISDPTTFEAKADAFLNTDLPNLQDQINTWAGQANALAAGMSAVASGAALSLGYIFSTTTTDADPGAGKLRLNQATQNTATVIRADLADVSGANWSTVLDSFDDSTSAIKGHISLIKASDGSKGLLFTVSAVAAPSGYRNITVNLVGASSANPFVDGDLLVLKFTANGDKGDAGATGATGLTIGPNLLINGGFMINQRGLSTVTDGNYDLDRWYVLTQTAAVAPSQLNNPETGAPFGARLSQSQASAQRFGRAQIVESSDCRQARAAAVTFSGRVRMSSAQTVRYAILEWAGTADSPSRDIVNSWTSATFTAGNFFVSANLNVLAVGSTALAANTWTAFSLSGTCGASMNNLIVFVWTDAAQAQNVALDLDSCKLEVGTSATPWQPLPQAQDLLLCQRYFEMSFLQGTTPAQNAGSAGAIQGVQIVGASQSTNLPGVRLRGAKRTAPTVTLYNPSAANGQIRNVSVGSTWSGSVASNVSSEGFGLGGTTPSGSSPGDGALVQFTADAEI